MYVRDLVNNYMPEKLLQSESGCTLCVSKTQTAMYERIAFCGLAPNLWNILSEQIKLAINEELFCMVIKSHLFNIVNSDIK